MSVRSAWLPWRLRTSAWLVGLLFVLVAGPRPAAGADGFLPAREAFKVSTDFEHGELAVLFDIAPGYYLYRHRFAFESATAGVTVGPPSFPVGEDHEDEFFGKQVIFRDRAVIGLKTTFNGPPSDFDLEIRLQGCADDGLCYPPQTWTTRVSMPALCYIYCPDAAISRQEDGSFSADADLCKGCAICHRECWFGAISMVKEG